MEYHKQLSSILKTVGINPNLKESEHEQTLKQLETERYNWQIDDIDLSLIHGYYQVIGREAYHVIQTPYKNFCISHVDNKYELFKIGDSYRPIVVSFDDHVEIKHWFEKQLGVSH